MKLVISLLFVISQFVVFSQTFEGEIKMKITYGEIPEEMQGYESMLPSEMIIQISGTKTRVVNESMMGSTIIVYDNATDKGFVLMDMLGQKIMTRTDVSEDSIDEEPFDVKKTTETKMIAGYSCTKYVVINSDSTVMDIWTTDGLIVPQSMKGLSTKAPGFPMEYRSFRQRVLAKSRQPEVTLTNDTQSPLYLCYGSGAYCNLELGKSKTFSCSGGKVYRGTLRPNNSSQYDKTDNLILEGDGNNCGSVVNASSVIK